MRLNLVNTDGQERTFRLVARSVRQPVGQRPQGELQRLRR